MAATMAYGQYVQQGISLLQVGALRIPCMMASLASVTRVAEIALRGISKTLEFIGFNAESTFAKWVTKGVSYVRPYRDEKEYTMKRLVLEAVALTAIGIVGNAFVAALFGPAPAIYNRVLEWLGPIRVVGDTHPLVESLIQGLGF